MEEKKVPQVSVSDLKNCITESMSKELLEARTHIESAFEQAISQHYSKSFLSGYPENVYVNLLHSMKETLKALAPYENE